MPSRQWPAHRRRYVILVLVLCRSICLECTEGVSLFFFRAATIQKMRMPKLEEIFGVSAKPIRSYVERDDVDSRFRDESLP